MRENDDNEVNGKRMSKGERERVMGGKKEAKTNEYKNVCQPIPSDSINMSYAHGK